MGDKMKYEKVKETIDKWDPIDLLYFAPKNEYDFEVKRIMDLASEDSSKEALGNIVHKVFMDSFGNNTFTKSMDECIHIASEMLK